MDEELVYFPDYLPNDGDDDHMLHIKESLRCLNSIQLKIFLSYCELGTYAALGRYYGVSSVTAKKYIEAIREKIFNNL